jgi:DNA-binding response OmpR family regulator
MLEIVVVEDHDLLRTELVHHLSGAGWRCRGAGDGEQLDRLLKDKPAHIVVLDLNLPGEDGLSIARRLRKQVPDLGIVMLTARGAPDDRAVGYGLGADVYLAKPANMGELESVIDNLSRRIPHQGSHVLQLDCRGLSLSRLDDGEVKLTPKEADLLVAFHQAPGHKLSATDLMLQFDMGQETGTSRRNLTVMISRLRQKIERELDIRSVIQAESGYGYRLTFAIEVLNV